MAKKILCIIVVMLALVSVLASCVFPNNAGLNTPENPSHTHTYGEWETTKTATCTADGTKERYCSCGEKQTATIAKAEHTYVDGVCSSCGKDKNENNSQLNTDEVKYNEACSLIENGNYEEAYRILKEIKNYDPAEEKIKNFFYAPTLLQYSNSLLEVSYDSFGNIESIISPDNEIYNFTYDSFGNVLSGYDLTYLTYNDLEPCVYTYKNGKLHTVSKQYSYSGSTDEYEYFYNDLGNISKIINSYKYNESTETLEWNFTYTYYGNQQIKTMQIAAGTGKLELSYDEQGKAIKMAMYRSEEQVARINMSYNSYGLSTATLIANGETQTQLIYTYDTEGRLTKIQMLYDGQYSDGFTALGFDLCYSENQNAKKRVSIINLTAPEVLFALLDG